MLRAEGHEITFPTGSVFRDRIENSGAKFVSLPPGADFDGRDILSVAPELKNIPPGLERFRVAIKRFFLDHIPAQHRGLLQAVQECRADVIVGDDMFFGVLPMLLGSQGGSGAMTWNDRRSADEMHRGRDVPQRTMGGCFDCA